MENLGEILKRLTANGISRTTYNGGTEPPEPEAPREVCSVCGGIGWVRHKVPLGHPHFGEVFPCQCQRQETNQERLRLVQKYSGLSQNMLHRMTFHRFDTSGNAANSVERESLGHAFTAATAFSQTPDGWVVLAGSHGCGKTHLAVSVAGEQIKGGDPVLFAFVPDLLDHLRSTFNPNSAIDYDYLFEQVKSAPLLILDDLGSESSTPWAQEKLYQIVVHRHNSRLPTIITTYLLMDDVEKAQPRLASRLKDPTLVNWITITAPDYRDPQRRRSPRDRQQLN